MRAGRPQVFRVCAVCGKRHGPTMGFRGALARAGFKDRGWGDDKAVEGCVKKFMADPTYGATMATGQARQPTPPIQEEPMDADDLALKMIECLPKDLSAELMRATLHSSRKAELEIRVKDKGGVFHFFHITVETEG